MDYSDESGRSRSDRTAHSRAEGMLLGLAVGDALGATLEFRERDSQPEVRDMVGGGPFGLKPGVWTDDTSMALCLADSLIACRGLDETDLMQRFVRWYREGENSVTGDCVDIGITTRAALAQFERTGELAADRSDDPRGAGNGSLMRLAPVPIFCAPSAERAAALADRQSRTTHTGPAAHDACRLFAIMLVEASLGNAKEDVLRQRSWDGTPEVQAIAECAWKPKARHEISSSGYSIATLEAALWAVWRTSSFEEALVLAVNLGDDSDTVGAVAGQLAGALYGREGIPQRWLDRLAWREHIENRVTLLLDAAGEAA